MVKDFPMPDEHVAQPTARYRDDGTEIPSGEDRFDELFRNDAAFNRRREEALNQIAAMPEFDLPALHERYLTDPRFHSVVERLKMVAVAASEHGRVSENDLLRVASAIDIDLAVVPPQEEELVEVALPGGRTGWVRRSQTVWPGAL